VGLAGGQYHAYNLAMTKKKALFMYSSELEACPYPADHPFNTTRARKTRALADSMGWLNHPGVEEMAPRPAERVQMKHFHSARYLRSLRNMSEDKWDSQALSMGIGTEDCPVFKGLFEHAALATGATLCAVERILDGSAQLAFNPSGGFHHAGAEKAAGFCYINDVALACLVLAKAGKRVLYLDIDVHHGDGVADAAYDRADIFTISLHENPKLLIPGTGFVDEIGRNEGKGYCVNIPLPMGTYDLVYQNCFDTVVLPLARAYDPDVFVLEFGADALAGDPLAHLQLTNNVYVDIIQHLLAFDRPILMTGGGGYHVENTVRAWALGWSVLCGAHDGVDMNLGMGGVMMESTEWQGGLMDRELVIPTAQRTAVARQINTTVETIKRTIFPIHGL